MTKILAYFLSVLFFIFFGLTLVIFHPIQWICLNLFGYDAHKRSVTILNLFLIRCTQILGTRYTFNNPHDLPTDRPLIVASNHQSMYDIPPLVWNLRKHHPKFVAKIELLRGVPSISYNLRHGGSVAIDRKDAKQAVGALMGFGKYIEKHNRGAFIFPEGTRSRTGELLPFRPKGLKTIMKYAPSALLVPVTINNSFKMHKYGKFPIGIGVHIKVDVHKPFENSGEPEALIQRLEDTVRNGLETA